MLVFVTGGARSGKSTFAREQLECLSGELLFVATAEAGDDEMQERILRHQQERGPRWRTLEEPRSLVDVLFRSGVSASGVLVDCVTLWISNLYFSRGQQVTEVLAEVDQFIDCCRGFEPPIYLVSNEVGSGIVPEHELAREFRDLAGFVNQRLAAAADHAYLLVAGLPLQLK